MNSRFALLWLMLPCLLAACELQELVPEQPRPSVQISSVRTNVSSTASSSSSVEPAPLEFADAPPVSSAGSGGDHIDIPERLLPDGTLELGRAEAPLLLEVFTNHHCSYCRTFETEYLPRLAREFVSTGTMRLHVILVPFEKYPRSAFQASAVFCAARQGKGHAMHALLFDHPVGDIAALLQRSQSLELDTAQIRSCLTDPGAQSLVNAQANTTKERGVTLAPTFILQGETSVGLPEYADLRGWIESTQKDTIRQ